MKYSTNFNVLLVLFLLTLVSAWVSAVYGIRQALLLAFLLKAMLVATFFMDLRFAHPIWRVALFMAFVVVFGVVLALN